MKYKIHTSSLEESRRIIELLLAAGYVFSTKYRLKTLAEAELRFTHLQAWDYFILGHNPECSRVIGMSSSTSQFEENDLRTFKTVTVEEFLTISDTEIRTPDHNNTSGRFVMMDGVPTWLPYSN